MCGGFEDALHKLDETLTVVLGRDARDCGVTVAQRFQSILKFLFSSEIGQGINYTYEVNEFAIG